MSASVEIMVYLGREAIGFVKENGDRCEAFALPSGECLGVHHGRRAATSVIYAASIEARAARAA